jgi:hypothetical protein
MNTVNAVGYLVGALGTAWAAAKLGQRTAFVGSLVVTVLALAATAATSSLDVLLAVRSRCSASRAQAPSSSAARSPRRSVGGIPRIAQPCSSGPTSRAAGWASSRPGCSCRRCSSDWGPPGWPTGWLVLAVLAAVGTAAATIAAYAAPTTPAAAPGSRRFWVSGPRADLLAATCCSVPATSAT